MKNKKLLYLLAPIAIILWGLIIIRIFKQINQAPEATKVVSDFGSLNIQKQHEDTFALIANYSDPFLEKKLGASYESGISKSAISKSNVRTATVKWPDIRYGGIIVNKNSKKILHLVKIDNVNHLMKPGEQASNVKLVKVYKDSIIIQSNNQRKTILKERKVK